MIRSYTSCVPLDIDIVTKLREQQRGSLRHIHAVLPEPTILATFQDLQTIDVWRPGVDFIPGVNPHDLAEFIGTLNRYQSAKRLFVGRSFPDDVERMIDAFGSVLLGKSRATANGSTKLHALEQLSIHGIDIVAPLFPILNGLLSWSQLTHLTVWRCTDPENFIQAAMQGNGDVPLRLKHFAYQTYPYGTMGVSHDLLIHFLDRCSILQSLVLVIHGDPSWLPQALVMKLGALGKTLRLLSLHVIVDSVELDANELDTLLLDLIEQICSQCPLLEQLGYQINSFRFICQEDTNCFSEYLVRKHCIRRILVLSD